MFSGLQPGSVELSPHPAKWSHHVVIQGSPEHFPTGMVGAIGTPVGGTGSPLGGTGGGGLSHSANYFVQQSGFLSTTETSRILSSTAETYDSSYNTSICCSDSRWKRCCSSYWKQKVYEQWKRKMATEVIMESTKVQILRHLYIYVKNNGPRHLWDWSMITLYRQVDRQASRQTGRRGFNNSTQNT